MGLHCLLQGQLYLFYQVPEDTSTETQLGLQSLLFGNGRVEVRPAERQKSIGVAHPTPNYAKAQTIPLLF
jgi:hypothetical protein